MNVLLQNKFCDNMNSGKYIFSQITVFLKLTPFNKLVKKYNGNYRAHGLTCYNQLLHLLFGQLSSCGSLRDICLCLKAHESSLFHMGFGRAVDHTALSRANERIDFRIYEELGQALIDIVRPLYASEKVDDVDTDLVLLALDSTTISVSMVLCEWALGRYSRGDVKMHALLDLRGSIPIQIYVSDGRWYDSNMLDKLNVEPLAIYVADKAYVDLEALWRIHISNAFFIVRPKTNMKFLFKEVLVDSNPGSNIVGDFTVELAKEKSRKQYHDDLRLVRALDEESGEIIDFITNNFELTAVEIANIYRRRWDIEVFFRWIKQNIVIKKLWGYSQNAVKTHLWVAICAYLLLAWIKKAYRSKYTITEIATLVSVSLFEKTDLHELLTAPDEKSRHKDSNQNSNELTLF